MTTAISFLQNPAVARSSIVQKQNFLRSKGLNDDEIQYACERAGVFTGEPNASTVINMDIGQTALAHRQQPHGVMALMHRVREVLSSTALLAGFAYAIYVVYKVCVTRFHVKYLRWRKH